MSLYLKSHKEGPLMGAKNFLQYLRDTTGLTIFVEGPFPLGYEGALSWNIYVGHTTRKCGTYTVFPPKAYELGCHWKLEKMVRSLPFLTKDTKQKYLGIIDRTIEFFLGLVSYEREFHGVIPRYTKYSEANSSTLIWSNRRFESGNIFSEEHGRIVKTPWQRQDGHDGIPFP